MNGSRPSTNPIESLFEKIRGQKKDIVQNIPTKRMLSDSSGSSLSPPQNPSKRLNDLDASFSDAILPEITSPSASEVTDTNFQQIIIDVLVSDCRVKLALENIVDNAVTNAVKKYRKNMKNEYAICKEYLIA